MVRKTLKVLAALAALVVAFIVIGAAAYDPKKDPELIKSSAEAALCETARQAFMNAPRDNYPERQRAEQLGADVTRYCHY